MAQVTVSIGGRSYRLACNEGEKDASRVARPRSRRQVEAMHGAFGEIGDQRLIVMAVLAIADEFAEAREKYSTLQADAERMAERERAARRDAEIQAVAAAQAFGELSQRVERLAAALSGPAKSESARAAASGKTGTVGAISGIGRNDAERNLRRRLDAGRDRARKRRHVADFDLDAVKASTRRQREAGYDERAASPDVRDVDPRRVDRQAALERADAIGQIEHDRAGRLKSDLSVEADDIGDGGRRRGSAQNLRRASPAPVRPFGDSRSVLSGDCRGRNFAKPRQSPARSEPPKQNRPARLVAELRGVRRDPPHDPTRAAKPIASGVTQ